MVTKEIADMPMSFSRSLRPSREQLAPSCDTRHCCPIRERWPLPHLSCRPLMTTGVVRMKSR
jgi:hypothetical protein